jgi:hypothetical protein
MRQARGMDERERQAEKRRLREAAEGRQPWRKWGPYLSERQWGTVRENVTKGTEAWNDVTHDQARSRAYLSGEDGVGGFSDDRLLLCFAVALWNGRDPIINERLFGLTNAEGNHGEDVKEYYFYLDGAPTHAYAKMLYRYPQAAYPYQRLLDENRRRSRSHLEYELMDTGVFDEDRNEINRYRQPALVPPLQRRRDLDARQMGVPVVRGVGAGLSRGGAGVPRSRARAPLPQAHVQACELADEALH